MYICALKLGSVLWVYSSTELSSDVHRSPSSPAVEKAE